MDSDDAGLPTGVIAAGVVIADRYRLVERIAGGGMGDVWQAVDVVLGRTVALKLLRPEYAEDAEFRERLRREARSASAINDVGVVPVYDFGEIERNNAPPLSYLVMEYVDGPSLSAEVSTMGPLGVERTLLILEQTASALQAAHDAGVIHRDVKPGNILVTPQGDMKITDFGISRASDAMPLTRTGMLTGTAKYLSPEQARGKPATEASDIYSLGIVAFACLTGDVPFNEGNDVSIALSHVQDEPPSLPADVPAGLRELIMRMLHKDPAARPASAGDVVTAARALRRGDAPTLGDHPFSVVPPATEEFPDPTKTIGAVAVPVPETTDVPEDETPGAEAAGSRRRNLRRGAIALLLVLVAAAAFILWQSGGTEVPDVVGQQREEAETELTRAGFRTEITTEDVAGEEKGIVTEQSDAPGSHVEEGATITLTVASGKVVVPTDDLLGATYDEATAILKDLGLEARRQTRASQKDAGTVIGVSPEGRADVGSTVTLTIAAAPVEPEPDEDEGNGQNGNGGTPTTAPPTTEPPTTEPPTTPPPTEEGADAG